MRLNRFTVFVLLNRRILLAESGTWNQNATSIQNGSYNTGNLSKDLGEEAVICRRSWATWLLNGSEDFPKDRAKELEETEPDVAKDNIVQSGARLSTAESYFRSTTSEIVTRFWNPVVTGTAVSTSIDCDGYPRIIYQSLSTFWQASLEFPKSPAPALTPSCTIHSAYCDAQWKAIAASERSLYISSWSWDRYTARFSISWDSNRPPLLRKRNVLPSFTFTAARYAISTKQDFLGGCLMPLDYCFYDEQIWADDPSDPIFLIAGKITADTAIPCTINAQNFALFYWPTSEAKRCATGDLDHQRGLGYSTSQVERVETFDSLVMTLPKSEIMSGQEPENQITITGPFTLTSPSIYLAYDAISATDKCRYRGKGIYRSSVIAIRPEEVSSLSVFFREKATRCFHGKDEYMGYHLDCHQVQTSPPAQRVDSALSSQFNAVDIGRLATREDVIVMNGTELEAVFTTVPVNFAHLQSPLAADAYLAAQFVKCPLGCSSIDATVLQHKFFPTLVVPSLFQRLDPAWSSCIADALVNDPPLTFPVAHSIASPTLNPVSRYVPTSAAAFPGASADPPSVRPTNRPQILKVSPGDLTDSSPQLEGVGSHQAKDSFVVAVQIVTIAVANEPFRSSEQARTSPGTQSMTPNQALLTMVNDMAVIGSVTMSAGGPAITTLGHTVSALWHGILYDGTLIPFPNSGLTALPARLSLFSNGVMQNTATEESTKPKSGRITASWLGGSGNTAVSRSTTRKNHGVKGSRLPHSAFLSFNAAIILMSLL